jgi:hypothetical protein
MRKKWIPLLEGAKKTLFTYIPRIFYMDSKNVQKKHVFMLVSKQKVPTRFIEKNVENACRDCLFASQ